MIYPHNSAYCSEYTIHKPELVHVIVLCFRRRQLFLDLIYESATESGYKVQRSLPLLKPLPLPASEMVYIELQPQTFLGVSVGEALEDHYYLLTLDPVPVSTLCVPVA